jgi:transposase
MVENGNYIAVSVQLLRNPQTEKLDITEVNSFLAGLKKDLAAVKNGIMYSYNNGLAEGSVNKLKLVKRIMYGRSSFALLKSKLLWLETMH